MMYSAKPVAEMLQVGSWDNHFETRCHPPIEAEAGDKCSVGRCLTIGCEICAAHPPANPTTSAIAPAFPVGANLGNNVDGITL